MTEYGWTCGMALLIANLKAPDLTPDMAKVRGETYRRMLGHLSDEGWLFAVDEAIREPGGWFPGVGDLLNYASRAPQPSRTALPAEPVPSPEERRETTKHGLEMLRSVEREAKRRLPPVPTVTAPEEPYMAVAKDDRLDDLRRQAAAIVGADSDVESPSSPETAR